MTIALLETSSLGVWGSEQAEKSLLLHDPGVEGVCSGLRVVVMQVVVGGSGGEMFVVCTESNC